MIRKARTMIVMIVDKRAPRRKLNGREINVISNKSIIEVTKREAVKTSGLEKSLIFATIERISIETEIDIPIGIEYFLMLFVN